jgi:hypothetical protein
MLCDYDSHYFNNVVDNSKKDFGKARQAKINVFKLLFKPEEYMHYFCKIRERCKSEISYAVYVPIGFAILFYCRLSIFIRHCIKNKDEIV